MFDFWVQRYGDFYIPTIPILWHIIYHTYGMSPFSHEKSRRRNNLSVSGLRDNSRIMSAFRRYSLFDSVLYYHSRQHKAEDGSDMCQGAVDLCLR